MKTMKMKMVSLFWIVGFCCLSINSFSQNVKLSRQELKEARKAQRAANFFILDSLLNSKMFVLEADYLRDASGYRIPVVSLLNFVKVNRENGILQTGSNSGTGYNSVGGVTAEGNVSGWKIFKDFKKQTYRLQFSLMTNIGHYDVSMVIMSDSRAMATITGLGPGKLTWEGHLMTLNNSRVFKGQNTI
jgi:hypothetical protein